MTLERHVYPEFQKAALFGIRFFADVSKACKMLLPNGDVGCIDFNPRSCTEVLLFSRQQE